MKTRILILLTLFTGAARADFSVSDRASKTRKERREIDNPSDVDAKEALRLDLVARQTELDARTNDLNALVANHAKAAEAFRLAEKKWTDFEVSENQRAPLKQEDLQDLETLQTRKNEYRTDEALMNQILTLKDSGFFLRLSDLTTQLDLSKTLTVDWDLYSQKYEKLEIEVMKKFVRSIDTELKFWRSQRVDYRTLNNATPRLRLLNAVLKSDLDAVEDTQQFLAELSQETEENIKSLSAALSEDSTRQSQRESVQNNRNQARVALDTASILTANAQKIKDETEQRRNQANTAYQDKKIGRITITVTVSND